MKKIIVIVAVFLLFVATISSALSVVTGNEYAPPSFVAFVNQITSYQYISNDTINVLAQFDEIWDGKIETDSGLPDWFVEFLDGTFVGMLIQSVPVAIQLIYFVLLDVIKILLFFVYSFSRLVMPVKV